jgi:hypothetical protein
MSAGIRAGRISIVTTVWLQGAGEERSLKVWRRPRQPNRPLTPNGSGSGGEKLFIGDGAQNPCSRRALEIEVAATWTCCTRRASALSTVHRVVATEMLIAAIAYPS